MCEDDRVSIDHPDELTALRAVGRVVAETIRELARRVHPGVSTGELDDVAADIFARHGAPGWSATSGTRSGEGSTISIARASA